MRYKSQAFGLEFILWVENYSRKKHKRYRTNREKFDNKVFKNWCLETGVQ